jgi:hypothetical protein
MNSGAVQLYDFRFPADDDIVIGSARIHVADIAARCGATVETRQDPELGPVYGFAIRLPSGRIAVVEESEYDIQEFRSEGPYISVLMDLVRNGLVDAVFGETVEALQLNESEIGLTPSIHGVVEQVKWVDQQKKR